MTAKQNDYKTLELQIIVGPGEKDPTTAKIVVNALPSSHFSFLAINQMEAFHATTISSNFGPRILIHKSRVSDTLAFIFGKLNIISFIKYFWNNNGIH